MAVVQISKIQLRHGNKLSGNGIPQLSTAEMAWTVDTQELFIGNGSIAEGAPYVGNTKILTEHDDLLSLVSSYKYERHTPSVLSVERSLQDKTDDYVSVTDFGATGNGVTDDSDAFLLAFESLFQNVNPQLRKTLFVPAGTYKIKKHLVIPSNSYIVGESKNTVLDIGEYSIRLLDQITDDPLDPRDNFLANHIHLENITISHTSGCTFIDRSRDVTFKRVKWKGNWTLLDTGYVETNSRLVFPVPIVTTGGAITVSGNGVSTTIRAEFASSYSNTLVQLAASLNNDFLFTSKYQASVTDFELLVTSKSKLANSQSIADSIQMRVLLNNQPGTLPTSVVPTLQERTDGAELVLPSVKWVNSDFGTSTSNVVFEQCKFENTVAATQCFQQLPHRTEISFRECEFDTCYTGVYVKGVDGQHNDWVVDSCKFNGIGSSAVVAAHGHGVVVRDCSFYNVGNSNSNSLYPIHPAVKFGKPTNNVVIGCTSDRLQNQTILYSRTPAVVEVENSSSTRLVSEVFAEIRLSDSFSQLALLPMNYFIEIDYKLVLSGVARSGTITIVTSENPNNIQFSDNYNYNHSSITQFQFGIDAVDYNNDGIMDTLVLKYKNPVITGATGSISYSITCSH